MKKLIPSMIAITAMSSPAMADLSSTVTVASDYMFNGVSQTMNDPALQASLDYAAETGWYVGTWASNVDYGDDTDLEWDFYVGQYRELNSILSVDYGIAYYTYEGGSVASDYNYPEVYAKWGIASEFGASEFNMWYSWDYFGTGAGHTIFELAHTFQLADNHAIRASVDTSNSLDGDKYRWQEDGTSYVHYRLAYLTSLAGFDVSVAAENTNLDSEFADERIVLAVSRTFGFN